MYWAKAPHSITVEGHWTKLKPPELAHLSLTIRLSLITGQLPDCPHAGVVLQVAMTQTPGHKL